jgi:uncharacterized membrane protein YhiD involved in acid resistance
VSSLVEADYIVLILLVCSVGLFLVALLATLMTLLLWRKNGSLVRLLHVESKRHTSELLALNERFNNQLYNQREQASLEHTATLRQLLESFSIAASGKPDA